MSDATHVYFVANPYNNAAPGVFRLPVGGGSVQQLNLTSFVALYGTCAVDETHVYFTEGSDFFGPQRYLRRLPNNGGVHEYLATEWNDSVIVMTVDITHVYWTTSKGAVRKLAKAGGPLITLASGQLTPRAIAVDATHVYWVNHDTGELMKVPK